MTDLPVRPHRKTLQQTSVILNVSVKTVRRYLDNSRLRWSGDQVAVDSIIEELNRKKIDDGDENVEMQIQQISQSAPRRRRVLSEGV